MSDPHDIGAIHSALLFAVINHGLKVRNICLHVEMDHPQQHPNIGCATASCDIDLGLVVQTAEPGRFCAEALAPYAEAIEQKNTELCRKAACKPKRSGKKKP